MTAREGFLCEEVERRMPVRRSSTFSSIDEYLRGGSFGGEQDAFVYVGWFVQPAEEGTEGA